MTNKEVLNVVVRGIGVWQAAFGLCQIPGTLWRYHYSEPGEAVLIGLTSAISNNVGAVIVGGFLFFGADWIVGLAYPDPNPPDDDNSN